MAPFTKEMLLQDFGDGLEVFSEVLGPFITNEAMQALVQPGQANIPLAGAKLTSALPATSILVDAYDFAYEGRMRQGAFLEEAAEIEGMVSLFKGLSSAIAFEGNAFHLCLRTMRMAHHRLCMMGTMNFTSRGLVPNHILLTELAEMAGLDDKTLRNMTAARNPTPLKTVKLEGRTYVSLNVAIPFLTSRGFKPTVVEDYSAARSFELYPFWSGADLGEYVQHGRRRLGLDHAAFAKRVRGDIDAPAIVGIEAGNTPSDEKLLHGLARALGVKDKKGFVTSALELHTRFHDALPGASI